jgi:AcrR family transcriptional regulator
VPTTAPRREQLLDAAAGLFASRGYHDVGIDDIGAAAGITGPGVYRHFAGKQALLEHLCDRAMSRMLDGALGVSRRGTLEELVDLHVSFAVGERALVGVWAREQRALSDEVRRSLRRRQRAYEQVWREVLLGVRPELPPDEAQVVVSATLGLLNTSALVDTAVPAPRLAALLRSAALAALRAPVGPG